VYHLYVGYRNYSSWSLRPWLLMRHFGIGFAEHRVPTGHGPTAAHLAYSDNGLVPCLHDDGFRIWDSLAIAEYLAERHPGLWPADPRARARARSVSCEMHSGFGRLRAEMPMNVRKKYKGASPSAEVSADVERVSAIWIDCRDRFASGAGPGRPWLFGDFSIADAMYAPLAWRFDTYNVPLRGAAAAYRDALLAHPAMREWERDAYAETVTLEYDRLETRYGGARDSLAPGAPGAPGGGSGPAS
jgi:glutathione S-transferase